VTDNERVGQLTREQIVARIVEVAKISFDGSLLTKHLRGSFLTATKNIKQVFGDLGKDFGFVVAASGYAGADDGEWLYDMSWFVSDPKSGLFLRQPLALESELNPGGGVKFSAAVDADFHKLVQARAEIRVWLAAVPNQTLAEAHIANCKQQARLFQDASGDDTYILILYNWERGDTFIESFRVDQT